MTKGQTKETPSRHFLAADKAWEQGDLARAFELFRQGAESGDPSCYHNLGYFFHCGLHGKRDQKSALRWYQKAYQNGEASAANNIAAIHRQRGESGRMIWWYRRALQLGDMEALFDLGMCYEKGLGCDLNLAKAAACYQAVLESDQVSEECSVRAAQRLFRLQRRRSRPPAAKPGTGITSLRKGGSRD